MTIVHWQASDMGQDDSTTLAGWQTVRQRDCKTQVLEDNDDRKEALEDKRAWKYDNAWLQFLLQVMICIQAK